MGGIGIGLRKLGYRIARAYDAWAEAVAIYNWNSEDRVATQCDLLSEEGRRQIRRDCSGLQDLDLLAAGPPCKGFSRLRNGNHSKPNPHNKVLLVIPEYVAMLRPRMVFLENVPDLMRHKSGRTFETLLARLRNPSPNLRYRVEYKTYDAAQYGVPQNRRRLFILAVRSGDERLPDSSPDLSALYAALRHAGRVPAQLKTYVSLLRNPEEGTFTTARDALSDLPSLGPGVAEASRRYRKEPRSAFQRWARSRALDLVTNTQTPDVLRGTVARLQLIPPGGCARSIPRSQLNGLSRRYDSAYRRLHPNVPSTALSTKYDCVYHYSRDRSLSVREYARLQGIPDHISFPESLACRRFAYEMIGNSVPPLLVERIFQKVLSRV